MYITTNINHGRRLQLQNKTLFKLGIIITIESYIAQTCIILMNH